MSAARKTDQGTDGWVSLLQGTKLLGESRLKVLARVVKGEVEGQHIAGRTVISRESIEKILAARDAAGQTQERT